MAGKQTMGTSLTLEGEGVETDLVLAHLQSIGEQATEAEEIDVTTLDSPGGSKEFIQGSKDAGSIEVTANNVFDGQAELLQSVFNSGSVRSWIETYPEAAGTLTYSGYLSKFTFGAASTDGLVTTNFTIRLTGTPVYAEA